MSLKYSNTTADFLEWNEAMNLIRNLFRDGNYKMSLLISLGCFWGLRISDILALHWNQILNVDEFTIQEKKTGKNRTIRINQQLKKHIADCCKHINPIGESSSILVSQMGRVRAAKRFLSICTLIRLTAL
ncbi:hypothetical protein D0T85_01825 [Bacteroides sp. 519]|nr:hypothetical protein [Bacteroides sp. 519]